MLRADGTFEVLKRINYNAYKVDLPCDFGVLVTFNVADLSAYQTDDYLTDLRIKSSQQGKDNGVPLGQDTNEGPKSLLRSNVNSKFQAMAHILEKSHGEASGLNGQKIPSFVHLIS